jgi:hypothetical protein
MLEKSRKLEKVAKNVFRKHIVTCKDSNNLVEMPYGSIAFSSITSSIPDEKSLCILLDKEGKDYDSFADEVEEITLYDEDLQMIETFIEKFFGSKKEKDGTTKFHEVLLTGNSNEERLNAKKRIYSSLLKSARWSTNEEKFKLANLFVNIINNEKVFNALREIVPMLGKKEGEK